MQRSEAFIGAIALLSYELSENVLRVLCEFMPYIAMEANGNEL